MKAVIAILILIILGAGAYFLLTQTGGQPNEVRGENMATTTKTYTNDSYGITFEYPAEYVLTEGERGNGERAHYAIVLIEPQDTDIPEGGEGPTAITIDIYQNNLDKLSLTDWMMGTNLSNYKLGNMTHASTSVDGAEAVQYTWDGLYTGETTAFLHNDNVVAVAVTYFAPTDAKVDAYRALLASIELK